MTTERSEDELRADLEELRGELSETVTELTHRVDVPARVRARREETVARAKAVGDQAKALVAEQAPAVRAAAGRSPAAFAAGAAGVLLLLVLLIRRSRRT
jgi:Protein of unknown function (DUF3618)